MSITDSYHPEYLQEMYNWVKYRYIMEGGDEFIDQYLKKFSGRESASNFRRRKEITPVTSFSKSAIVDVKNSIFQRMGDIQRIGGSKAYQEVIRGERGGVDRNRSSMNYFIGMDVLPELLFLGKIGVYVDMPVVARDLTIAEAANVNPYFYTYPCEDILNWNYDFNINNELVLTSLLLRERRYKLNEYGLPSELIDYYKLFKLYDDGVRVEEYSTNGELESSFNLELRRIPFVLFEIDQPLTKDIANHQIALMNLESSDIGYTLKANYPFYTEQQGMATSSHLKGPENNEDGSEIEVGGNMGRGYSKGLERPGFIHPSSEPLKASMEKQQHLKDDIRTLVNLALTNVASKFSSAESKEMDERGLESGLSAIGLVLEQGERELAYFFHQYEKDTNIPKIIYPTRYSLKTERERLEEVNSLSEQRDKVPSKKCQKIISKKMANILVGTDVNASELIDIYSEIDNAGYLSSTAKDIHGDIDKGLVSLETASRARGYNPKEVEQAKKDHAERIARIQAAQSNAGARGITDLQVDSDDSVKEKNSSQSPEFSDTGTKKTRGENK